MPKCPLPCPPDEFAMHARTLILSALCEQEWEEKRLGHSWYCDETVLATQASPGRDCATVLSPVSISRPGSWMG